MPIIIAKIILKKTLSNAGEEVEQNKFSIIVDGIQVE